MICLQVCVCPQGDAIAACIPGGIPACLAAGLQRGCFPSMHCRWYPSMSCSRSPGGLQAHTQGGSGGGSGPGPQPRGKLREILSRSTAKGEIEGDLVQAHSQEGSWGGSGPGGLISGGACSWGVPASGWCLVETLPPTATAAGSMHPTGMHSCCWLFSKSQILGDAYLRKSHMLSTNDILVLFSW